MPSLRTVQKRSRTPGSEEEDISDSGSSASSQDSKRARTTTNSRTIPSRDGPVLPQNYVSQSAARLVNGFAKGPASSYQPGSIVRVKLVNFVTYTFVEFFPGPSLNMVIGPNGTGKSTLVCAICLGLGWGPQHLGRAKEVSEFVKHGSQEASVEIELQCDGLRYRRNPVIRCNLKREGNKSSYTINGKQSNKKQVLKLARSFSIQIDNLCQFLPQDKVVEFAAMSPVELLGSTQRAVASQNMIDWHEQLKEMRREQRAFEVEIGNDEDTLKNLEGRQRMQEADVARLREREAVKERVRLLEVVRPVAVYRDIQVKYRSAKEARDNGAAELSALESEVEPTMRAVNAKQAYAEKVRSAFQDRVRKLGRAEEVAMEKSERIGSISEELGQVEKEEDSERKSARDNKSEIARIDGIIHRLKVQMEQAPGDFDIAACNEEIRDRERQMRELQDEAQKIKDRQQNINDLGREKTFNIEKAQQEIKAFESQAGRQTVKLKQVNSDTFKAWQWIQEHQDEFKQSVYGPPMVECSVTDTRYVPMIEMILQAGDLTALTVQNKDDFEKLHKILHEELHLKKLNIRTAPFPLERWQRPSLSEEDMGRFGLDCWALEQITGPDAVLSMLCDSTRLHSTGLAMRDTTEAQYELLEKSVVSSWVTSKSSYKIVRRREYGASSTQTRETRPAQIWTDQPVDATMRISLLENIERWSEERENLKKEIDDLNARLRELSERRDMLSREHKGLKEEKEKRQQILTTFRSLPTRLASQEEKLGRIQASMEKVKTRIKELRARRHSLLLEKGEAAIDYANHVEFLRVAYNEAQETEIMHIEAVSDYEVLADRNGEVKKRLEGMRAQLNELKKIALEAQAQGKRAQQAVKKILADAREDPVLKEFLDSINKDQSSEELEDEIESEKAKLEFIPGDDGNVLVHFERRQRDIEKLKEKIEEHRDSLNEVTDHITKTRSKWEPELDRLVSLISGSFSYNMKQIDCAGEVSIHKDEDFDQWAIMIQVKFRENEPLSQLDSHRQSGGERAVSTIFYLMSLQSLTRSPFRVVDEINQGMDPRNERLVHSRMVSIATGNDNWRPPLANPEGTEDEADKDQQQRPAGSQYFLITPKLLHDLEYQPGMRVLCIASGEYVPDEVDDMSFSTSLAIRKRMTAAAG